MARKVMRASNGRIKIHEPFRVQKILSMIESTSASVRLDKLRESISPDNLDALLSNYMNRRLADGYQVWDVNWRNVVSVRKNVTMLTQRIVRIGEFTNLDELAKTGGVFQEINPPSDDEITYSVGGWGNIIAVDFKTKKSDDLGWFDKMSFNAGKAGIRTLHKWLFVNNLQSNPTVDDGNSLFDDTNHSNDNDSAGVGKILNYANLAASYEKVRAQTDANGEPIYVTGVWIVCGTANEINAETLQTSEYNPDTANREPNFFKKVIKGYVICPYLGNDWYLYADPKEFETFEVGFLDDEEDPQLLMLDPEISDEYFKTKHTMWRIESYFGGNWVPVGPASKQFEDENLVNCLGRYVNKHETDFVDMPISRQAMQGCMEASETIPYHPDRMMKELSTELPQAA